MRCFHPISAWQLESGEVVFVERGRVKRSLTLRCGQCIGCRVDRSRQWALRCMHESQLHDFSVFVTLTYDDEHLVSPSLEYRDFQLFMKRLRFHYRKRVRFYMCGEYGDINRRPHFHGLLFGCFFSDRRVYRTLPSGHTLYTSSILSGLWPHGFSSIGDVTFDSAAYVARYVVKKVTGSIAASHYEAVDADSGEIVALTPEFSRMSLRPGIGAEWFAKYRREVFGRDGQLDRVIMNGFPVKPPDYYYDLLKKSSDFDSDMVEFMRYQKGRRFSGNNTREQLAVSEKVASARLQFKKRSL